MFFYMHHPTDRIAHTMAFVTTVMEHWLEQEHVETKTIPSVFTNTEKHHIIIERKDLYQLYKERLTLENYINILPEKLWIIILKFRTSNQYLPVETGRWNDILTEDRICSLCRNDIGDKFHYLFTCDFIHDSRAHYLHPYFYIRPSTYKVLLQNK